MLISNRMIVLAFLALGVGACQESGIQGANGERPHSEPALSALGFEKVESGIGSEYFPGERSVRAVTAAFATGPHYCRRVIVSRHDFDIPTQSSTRTHVSRTTFATELLLAPLPSNGASCATVPMENYFALSSLVDTVDDAVSHAFALLDTPQAKLALASKVEGAPVGSRELTARNAIRRLTFTPCMMAEVAGGRRNFMDCTVFHLTLPDSAGMNPVLLEISNWGDNVVAEAEILSP